VSPYNNIGRNGTCSLTVAVLCRHAPAHPRVREWAPLTAYSGPAGLAVFAKSDGTRYPAFLQGTGELESDACPIGGQRAMKAQGVRGNAATQIARSELTAVRAGKARAILLQDYSVVDGPVLELNVNVPLARDVDGLAFRHGWLRDLRRLG